MPRAAKPPQPRPTPLPCTDYAQWLTQLRGILKGKNGSGICRWLAEHTGTSFATCRAKLTRMLRKDCVPHADFAFAINAWVAAGCPNSGFTLNLGPGPRRHPKPGQSAKTFEKWPYVRWQEVVHTVPHLPQLEQKARSAPPFGQNL